MFVRGECVFLYTSHKCLCVESLCVFVRISEVFVNRECVCLCTSQKCLYP